MIENQIGRRYAEAIYEIAEETNEIQEMHAFLNAIMELYKEEKDFRNFILHPLLGYQEKKEVLEEIFPEVKKNYLEVAFYILRKGRMPYIRNIVAEYLKIYYEKHQILDVLASFAVELTEEQKRKLIQKLEDKTKREIRLETRVNPDLIGGGVIQIGDQVIDGSIKKELSRIKEKQKVLI